MPAIGLILRIKYVFLLVALACSILFFKRNSACVGLSAEEALPNQIQLVQSYCQVQKVFDACDQHTLVTFDVDDTLITANDVLARTPEVPLWFKICLTVKYFTVFWNTETREKAINDYLGTFFQQVPRFIFDPDVVQLIKQLQQQKCKVVGLTTMGSGSAGTIKSLPEWRASMLKGFDIDFSGAFDDASFTAFPVKHNSHPCLHKGIICANYLEKGPVLGAFLDHHALKPKQIISFDDQQCALDSIAAECSNRGIPFYGHQIVGAKTLPGEWNTRRALLQFDTALQSDRWLNDDEADAILAGKGERT